jgi:Tfp pilus assembly protein PilV
VEVMVASLVLTLFLGGALNVLIQTMRSTDMVRRRTEATNLAWSRVERAMHMDFLELPELAEGAPGTAVNRAGLPDADGGFLRRTTLTPLEGAMPGMRIRVEVWPVNPRSGQFAGQPETIETVIANIPRVFQEDA